MILQLKEVNFRFWSYIDFHGGAEASDSMRESRMLRPVTSFRRFFCCKAKSMLKHLGVLAKWFQSTNLVGGWTNPSEKYARQIGSFPQVGVKISNVWNHHLVMVYWWFGSRWFGFRLDPLMKGTGDSFSISWFKAVENIFVKMGIFPNFLGGEHFNKKSIETTWPGSHRAGT